MVNDFVARIDQRAQRDVHRFAHADGDQNLRFRTVGHAKMLLQAGALMASRSFSRPKLDV